jgi:hypothetical protein
MALSTIIGNTSDTVELKYDDCRGNYDNQISKKNGILWEIRSNYDQAIGVCFDDYYTRSFFQHLHHLMSSFDFPPHIAMYISYVWQIPTIEYSM